MNTFRSLVVLSGLALGPVVLPAQTPVQPVPAVAQRSQWNGYERIDFGLVGRAGVLVQPKTPAEGRPWIWRTVPLDRATEVDLALLARGWYVAYTDVANLYGSRRAVGLMGDFYAHLVTQARLAPKVVIEGLGRGALEAMAFAATHPSRVAAVYLAAPVLDFGSWPGNDRSSPEWREFLEAHNLTEQSVAAFRGNPIDRSGSLAAARLPIVAVYGDADRVAPPATNIRVLEQRYRERGAKVETFVKKGAGHEPYGLDDPAPVVEFIVGTFKP